MRMVSLGHAARMKAGIKVRQPLGRTLFKMRTEDEAASLKRLAAQMADELNTKELGVLDDVADVAGLFRVGHPIGRGQEVRSPLPQDPRGAGQDGRLRRRAASPGRRADRTAGGR